MSAGTGTFVKRTNKKLVLANTARSVFEQYKRKRKKNTAPRRDKVKVVENNKANVFK